MIIPCFWEVNLIIGGSLFVTFSYICIVMLICKLSLMEKITNSFAAVGRMALTNYLLHTLICTIIFYGHGFGLFGKVERLVQIIIVIAIWILQLIVSLIWFKYFKFGPAEWLWRILTYLKAQPMKI